MDNSSQMITASISDRGLSEKRPVNEDSMLCLERFGLFAVADGVGGAQAGDVASQMAIEILGEAFLHYGDTVDPEEIMKVSIERANEAIHQMASELPQLASMATTIAAIQISGDIVTIAHVGDSRVYRIDPEGMLHRETNDHSVVEEEVRAGRMTPEQALTHPSRNIISRAVGAESTVDVEIKTIMIDPGTVFLICTDGITRHITDEEIGQLLTTGMSPEMLCQQMKDICYERGAEDNLTAIIVQPSLLAAGTDHIPAGTEDDVLETETVATPRSPIEPPTVEEFLAEETSAEERLSAAVETETDEQQVSAASAATEPIPTEDEVADEPETAASAREQIHTPAAAGEQEYVSSSMVVPAGRQGADPDLQMFGNTTAVKTAPKISSGSVIGTILSSLIWLVLGSLLGITGYYLWHKNNVIEPEVVPPQLVEKTTDIQLNAFAEGRRLVDEDPEAYIKARAASPKDAFDFYLLGRAFLLTNEQFNAGRQFGFAKERLNDLSEADEKYRATLEAEIAIGQALLRNQAAVNQLIKDIEAIRAERKKAEPQDQTNVNTNTSNMNTSPN